MRKIISVILFMSVLLMGFGCSISDTKTQEYDDGENASEEQAEEQVEEQVEESNESTEEISMNQYEYDYFQKILQVMLEHESALDNMREWTGALMEDPNLMNDESTQKRVDMAVLRFKMLVIDVSNIEDVPDKFKELHEMVSQTMILEEEGIRLTWEGLKIDDSNKMSEGSQLLKDAKVYNDKANELLNEFSE